MRLNDLGPPATARRCASRSSRACWRTRSPPATQARRTSAATTSAPHSGRSRSGLREHWLVRTRWDPAPGALAGRVLEVLDTEDGYWLVVPDDPTVELWPTTPTMVFRSLAGLFPMAAEVAPRT